jgi:hypothetical protein
MSRVSVRRERRPPGWREHRRDPVDHRLAPAVQAATMEHGAMMVWGLGRHGYRVAIITPTTSEGAKAERPPQVDRFGPRQPRAERCGVTVRGLRADELVLERVADEIRAFRQAQLLLDVRAVLLDRANREAQLVSDLVVGVPERDQAQHLDLSL